MSLESDFSALYEQWFAAVMAGDPELVDPLIAEDWVYTDIFGTVWDKPAYLELIRALAGTGIVMRLTDLEARPHGDLTLITGEYAVKGVLPTGKDLSSDTRFTALWSRAGSTWRSLAHHATRRVPADSEG